MDHQLPFRILPQPDDATCGPTCLHSIYHYYGDDLPLGRVIDEVSMLQEGGTLAVLLACHALQRGYLATIYSYKLQLFDPTWFNLGGAALQQKLRAQMRVKKDPKLHQASEGYLRFLDLGGQLKSDDLTATLIRKYVAQSIPVLTGLSSTYLHQTPREFGVSCDHDDVRGEPAGHFVVLCGYDREKRTLSVADPLSPNPLSEAPIYSVSIHRVLNAILLGVLTYDANLLIIRPGRKGARHA
jgi:hypothetical protein